MMVCSVWEYSWEQDEIQRPFEVLCCTVLLEAATKFANLVCWAPPLLKDLRQLDSYGNGFSSFSIACCMLCFSLQMPSVLVYNFMLNTWYRCADLLTGIIIDTVNHRLLYFAGTTAFF